jgi:hypothetical protein
VTLSVNDISAAGGAVLASPAFTGTPTAPTAAVGVSTTQLATTAYVMAAVAASAAGVTSFNGRNGVVTLALADVTGVGGAPNASPGFTGVPTAPTAAANTSTTQIATTAFVTAALASTGVVSFNSRTGAVTLSANDVSAAGGALLASPTFTGVPAAPTAAPGVSTTQLATCAFVSAAISAATGVASFNGRAGVVTLTAADLTNAGGALLSGATFTGDVVVSGPSSAFALNKSAGANNNVIYGQAGGINRWGLVLGNATAEGSGNVGSDFNIARYSNAGALIDYPLSITRSSGAALFAGNGSVTISAASPLLTINSSTSLPQLNFSIANVANSFINDNGGSFNFYSNSAASAGLYILRGASAWTALSDARMPYKKTARRLSALERLAHVQLYENEVDGRLELFAKAQEMDRAFPHIVKRGDDDASYVPDDPGDQRAWGLCYDRIGIIALQGVKELLARITALEAELENIRRQA